MTTKLRSKTFWTINLTIACALLLALAATPLQAQYSYADLYNFSASGGISPFDFGQLAEGSDLYLYGTTEFAGANGWGTIFKVSPDGTSFVDLWDFPSGTDESFSTTNIAALTLAGDGYFYGTTGSDGNGYGTLFRIGSSFSASPGPPTILHNFDSTEGPGASRPIQARDGNLYGITGNGITYRFDLATQTYQLLANSVPGFSFGGLLLASNGYLYGAAVNGGEGIGTIFSIATPSGTVTVIHTFTGPDGAIPFGPLAEVDNPVCKPFMHCVLLYGTTASGGANGAGVVFQVAPSGAFTVLHSFDENSDGGSSYAGLLLAPNGQLLGVNFLGGGPGWGTIFQISTAGSFTTLFNLTGSVGPQEGGNPGTTLMQHTNGCLYGLTAGGGNTGYGGGTFGVFYDLCPEAPGPIPILIVEGPIFVPPGVPVEIIGADWSGISALTFGGVQAQFQTVSETLLRATVPTDAVDGYVVATFPSGAQVQSAKQMYILPQITNLDPTSGPVGQEVDIVGGGFAGATGVEFGSVKATSFTVLSPNLIQATVPAGAVSREVCVTTPNGTATSTQTFTVN